MKELDESGEIRAKLRTYIAEIVLERRASVADETPLLTSGILDSYSMLMLANYIDEEFGIPADALSNPVIDNVGELATVIIQRKREAS